MGWRFGRSFLQLATNVFQLDRHVLDVLITIVRVLRETATDDALQIGRRGGIELRDQWRWFADDLVKRVDRVSAGERLMGGDCFKQNAAKGKDVRSMIDLFRLALRLFGRHVTTGAHDCARTGFGDWNRHCVRIGG